MDRIDYEKIFPPHVDPRASLSDALYDIGLEADGAAIDVLLDWADGIIAAAAGVQREACAVGFSRKADEHTQLAARADYTPLRDYHEYAARDWAQIAERVRATKLITESEAANG